MHDQNILNLGQVESNQTLQTEHNEEINSTLRRLRTSIRNTPMSDDSKYLEVWQRARKKLRAPYLLGRLQEDIRMYGTQLNLVDHTDHIRKDVGTLIKRMSSVKREKTKKSVVYEHVPFCMFHPSKTPKSVWNFVLSLLLIYTATIMPYKMAFIDSEFGDAWFILDALIDFLFFFDVCVNLCTAFYDIDGHLITNRWKIFLHYLRSWMILDVIACIPFNLIEGQEDETASSSAEHQGSNANTLLRLVRLPRLYRLLRISRLFKMLKKQHKDDVLEKIQDYLSLNSGKLKIAISGLSVLVILHVAACFWYFIAKIEGFGPDNWVTKKGYLDDSTETLYLAAFYWALMTLTTVGFGDISAGTALEMIFAMIWMTFGMVFFSLTIGGLSSMLSSLNTKDSILNTKLIFVEQFCNEANLGRDLRRRLKHAIKYSAEKVGYSWSDKQQLFNEFPTYLRYELAMAMHHGAVKKLTFFANKDRHFITSVVPFMQHMHVASNDYVYTEGEHSDEVYFINKGRVHFVYGPKNIQYKSLNAGSYFGEIEIIRNLPRMDTIQALVNCEMLTLNKTMMLVIENDFPIIFREIDQLAKARMKNYQKAKIDLVKLLKLKKKTQNFANFNNIDMKFMDETPNTSLLTDSTMIEEEDVFNRIDALDRDIVRLERHFERADNAMGDLIAL